MAKFGFSAVEGPKSDGLLERALRRDDCGPHELRPGGVVAWLLLVVLLVLMTHGVSNADINVVDDAGFHVRLEKPASRIASLAPHVTELLYAAGAGENVVGVVSYSDFPAAAQEVAQVGSYKSISQEALIALKPDLVIAWRSGNGPEIISRLRQLGLTVYVNEPQTLPDVAHALRVFGQLAGRDDAGEEAALAFLSTYGQLQQRYRGRRPVLVFYQVWNEPLTTLNGQHLISDIIRLCGGRNVFAEAIPLAPRVSVESVVRLDPEVIVASGMGESRPEWLDDWKDWPSIKAVREDKLYFVPPDLLQRHTPRILEGALMLCEYLDRARHKSNAGTTIDDRRGAR